MEGEERDDIINKKTSVVVRSINLTIEGTIIVMECYDTCAALLVIEK